MTDSSARVVLLGASNLVRGMSTAVGTAQAVLTRPVEVLIAMGHGRSYGAPSRVLGRSLPGIAECGLWAAIETPTDVDTFALVTDIGNDVMYGAPVETILGWVDRCLERLTTVGSRTILTRLPIESIEAMSRAQYEIARAILFPTRRISMADAQARARDLHAGVDELGRARGVRLVDQQGSWYGPDPVHIRYQAIPAAWAAFMGAWSQDGQAGPVGRSAARWLALRRLTPEEWWLFGRRLGRPQPAGALPDGTAVSMY